MLPLTVKDLCKNFQGHQGQNVKALDHVNFSIKPGEIFTLLGPSGCGKTTTLRSIAGLEKPDSGQIQIGERFVFNSQEGIFVQPNERQLGMVFQSYAIWPHMNVFDNVAFPLRQRRPRISKSEIQERVKQALQTVQMEGYERRSATQLSGGQQQRLALARAIVSEPKLLLLDEPLSNLDAKLRELMRFELKRLQHELGITTVYVTHDQTEALALSSHIAVMKAGHIVQLGTPYEIYRKPNSQFVADFIGSTNFIQGRVHYPVSAGFIQRVETEEGVMQCIFYEDVSEDSEVLISVRPENITLTDQHETTVLNETTVPNENLISGKVANRVFLGEFADYIILLNGKKELRVRTHSDQEFQLGQQVYLRMPASKCVIIPFTK